MRSTVAPSAISAVLLVVAFAMDFMQSFLDTGMIATANRLFLSETTKVLKTSLGGISSDFAASRPYDVAADRSASYLWTENGIFRF